MQFFFYMILVFAVLLKYQDVNNGHYHFIKDC